MLPSDDRADRTLIGGFVSIPALCASPLKGTSPPGNASDATSFTSRAATLVTSFKQDQESSEGRWQADSGTHAVAARHHSDAGLMIRNYRRPSGSTHSMVRCDCGLTRHLCVWPSCGTSWGHLDSLRVGRCCAEFLLSASTDRQDDGQSEEDENADNS